MEPEERVISILKQYEPQLKGKQILELGCGVEFVPRLCDMLRDLGADVFGIDKHAEENDEKGFRIIQTDMKEIDEYIKDMKKKFDVVITNRLFAVLDDTEKEKVINICEEYLKKDGIALHIVIPKYFGIQKEKLENEFEVLDIFEKDEDVVVLRKK